MRPIKKLYRDDYTGESLVTDLTWEFGAWHLEQEQQPANNYNVEGSTRAIVIGNGVSRKEFPLHVLKQHQDRNVGQKTFRTYGCNALYRDFTPNFLIAVGDKIAEEISQTRYTHDNIVYAPASITTKYPGEFYLIPQDPGWNSGAVATYMACFDGHKIVYLFGFDGIEGPNASLNIYDGTPGYDVAPSYGYSEDYWVKAMLDVFNTYNDVEFIRVMPTEQSRMPEEWKYVTNLRQISVRDFVIEADL